MTSKLVHPIPSTRVSRKAFNTRRSALRKHLLSNHPQVYLFLIIAFPCVSHISTDIFQSEHVITKYHSVLSHLFPLFSSSYPDISWDIESSQVFTDPFSLGGRPVAGATPEDQAHGAACGPSQKLRACKTLVGEDDSGWKSMKHRFMCHWNWRG